MARRRESVFDTLLVLPWWVAVAFGAAGYALIAYLPPLLITDGMLAPAARGLTPVARLWFFVCVAAAVFSAIRAFFVARKFDQQHGLASIRSLHWRQFESVVGEAFRRRGYTAIENAVDGADGGVDLVLRKDGQKFFVQCKQWKKLRIGVKPVRELFGVISAQGADGGFFVCSGDYSEEARAFAATCSVQLIDGPMLAEMIEATRRGEPFLDPTIRNARSTTTWNSGSDAPQCPTCGTQMVARTAKRGANAGANFWGCAKYPACRGTREIR